MIAVVDDDAQVRHAIARLLRSAGYAVVEYSSGAQFMASLIERGPLPVCVVLDLHMPELSGFEVQEAVARYCYDIPIIVVTGDTKPENIKRAVKLGALCCLPKPLDDARLLGEVRKAC